MFPSSYFSGVYFSGTYFSGAAAAALLITSTRRVRLPVNCVLAGQQPYKFSGREWEIRPSNVRTAGRVPRSRAGRIRGAPPSFTVTTNNRGYD